jgi:FkbM family methyltransferase
MSDLIDRISKYQARVGMHRAGACSPDPLRKLEWYFREHFRGQPLTTIETGCGASTIVFANYAAHHTVYCYDDRDSEASSVSYAQNFPGFRADTVRWIFGPTQRTIFAQPPQEQVDIVLLDGPHGYPFPQLEYFVFYAWLRPGGILIVDDIQIPTINELYRFLLQDDSFRCHSVTNTTAYFERTNCTSFDMAGDGWWLQRYNAQRFPAVPLLSSDPRVELPVTLAFDGALPTHSSMLARGFSVLDSPPLTDGAVSLIQVPIANPVRGSLTVQLDIEPVSVSEREDPGITVLLNGREIGSWAFKDSRRRTLEMRANGGPADVLTLEFQNRGLKAINDLQEWVKPWFDARMPNFRLHSLTIGDSELERRPSTLQRVDGSITTFEYDGQHFSLFTDEPEDRIQAFHTVGRFYALNELELLRSRVRGGACILDVGAHIGNHTVYFAKAMGARRVIPIEPNPRAAFILRTNCVLNSLNSVDFTYLGRALGRNAAAGSLVRAERFNSDGVRVRLDGGPIDVFAGDDLFAAERFDLIKIDAGGMELQILEGLTDTIRRCQPVILIQLGDQSMSELADVLKRWRFEATWTNLESPGSTTYMLTPQGPGSSSPRVPSDVVRAVRPFVPPQLRKPIKRIVGLNS